MKQAFTHKKTFFGVKYAHIRKAKYHSFLKSEVCVALITTQALSKRRKCVTFTHIRVSLQQRRLPNSLLSQLLARIREFGKSNFFKTPKMQKFRLVVNFAQVRVKYDLGVHSMYTCACD